MNVSTVISTARGLVYVHDAFDQPGLLVIASEDGRPTLLRTVRLGSADHRRLTRSLRGVRR